MDGEKKIVGQAIEINYGTVNQNIHLVNKPKASPLSIASAKGFVGREDYLHELDEWYADGARVFVLHGLGGVGKTALAQKFTERIKDYYDTHIYIDLQGVNENPLSPADVMVQILREYDPNIPDGIALEKLQNEYISLLNRQRILLLLDNAKDDQQVAPLNKSNNSCLLVTARESSFLMGAKLQRIEQMSNDDAKTLLFSIADEERFEGQAGKLAHLAGYLPMALLPLAALLAKNYMENAADLVRKYQSRKERLSLSNPTYRDNITVYASFDLSYEILSDELKKYWRQLAVFPGDFHNGGPAYVWNVESKEKLEDALKLLCQYNLLNGNKDTERYRLHDLARDYLNEKIKETGEEELDYISQRHAEFYTLVIKEANSFIEEQRYKEALYYFDLERINIEAGKEWAKSFVGKNNIADQLCLDYSHFSPEIIVLRLHPRKVIEWHTTALNSARQLNDPQSEMCSLRDLGIVHRNLGEYQNAINRYNEALRVSRKYKNRRIECEALSNLGLIYCDLGEFNKAFIYHKQAIHLKKEIIDHALESKVLCNLGMTHRRINPFDAIEFFERSLHIAQVTKNQRDESIYLGNLGKTYLDLMKYDKAIDILEQALLLVREISDRESEGLFLGDLGVAYNKSGNEEKGQELLRTSIYILRAIDSPDVNSFRMELQQLPPRAFVRELVGEIINMPVGCLIWIIIVEAIIGLYLLLNWLNKI